MLSVCQVLLLLYEFRGKSSLQAECCREGFQEEGGPHLDTEDRVGRVGMKTG